MFRWRPAETIFGEIMHIAQSPVGKVLSSEDIVPPIEDSLCTRWTLKPLSARSSAACMPPMPPPTTRTDPRLPEDERTLMGSQPPLPLQGTVFPLQKCHASLNS